MARLNKIWYSNSVSNSFVNINSSHRYDTGHGHGSSANESEVEDRDEYQMQNDKELVELGFEIPEYMFGKGGRQLETNCIWPINATRMPPTIDKVDLSEDDPPDEVIIQNAIDKSPLRSDWPNRRENLKEWFRDLYDEVCEQLYTYLKERVYPNIDNFGIDVVRRLVKPVPSLGTRSDFTKNCDCFFVIHDLFTFYGENEWSEKSKTRNKEQRAAFESAYWNSDYDTVVNVDLTVSLDQKNGRKSNADIVAAKTDSRIQDYLIDEGVPQIKEINEGISFQDRMHVLAKRVVEAYRRKSGLLGNERLPHIYDPEAHKEKMVEREREESRQKARQTMIANRERNKRKETKKEKSKRQSEEAKLKKDPRARKTQMRVRMQSTRKRRN